MVSPDYDNSVEEEIYDFATALNVMVEDWCWVAMSWSDDLVVFRYQEPDENSKMTKPYFYAETLHDWKVISRFPIEFSTQQILANDWLIIY